MQTNALLSPNPRAVIGGNQPPLSEALPVETADLRARAKELIESATERATVTTEDEADRATVLFAMLRDHWGAIEEERTKRKAPFLEAGRIIDAHFAEITLPIVGPNPKQRIAGAAGELLARINAYRQAEEAKAETLRQRLAEEARSAREAEEVAELRRQAAEDRATRVEAELEARAAADRAAQLEAQSEQRAPVVIRSGYGPTASGRTQRYARITNLRIALAHCVKIDRHRIEAAVLDIYKGQLRAGVQELPGAEIESVTNTIVRR